jgi:glycine/D-amino acid oxidase-like deaminating enzyme
MEGEMESYIIVGGGLAGLTAANALAGRGDRVTLIEQSEHLGGRAVTHRERGYSFNLGPHALYRGGRALETLRGWNIAVNGRIPALGAGTYMVRDGRKYDFFTNTRGLLRTNLFGWPAKLEAARLLGAVVRGSARPGETMDTWVKRHARSGPVRDLAASLARVSTYTADLAHLSARAALDQIRLARQHNVLYLDGGWQTLVDPLAERARSLGVEIRCGQPVENLRTLDASAVILAVPPRMAEQIAGKRLPALRPVRAATLDLGMRIVPDGAARFALGLDQPIYFSQHSATAQLAPAGAGLVHLSKYLVADENPATVRAELEAFADLVMPGWQRTTDVMRFLPNLTVTHAIAAPEGRPDVDAVGIDRVAVAGDWAGPEGMLADTAVASALRAADMVQRRKVKAA